MANNNGGSGSKFVSVNLNKLYGQPSHHNHPSHSGSYAPGVGTNRARPGGHASTGGGMVVLSRNRPLQKAIMPKLSVPPPLNLPSLRKEYQKVDASGAGSGMTGGAGPGTGSRPSSSGMGWTKPINLGLQEKEVSNNISESMSYSEGAGTKVNSAYMPPSARFGGERLTVASIEKATVLRGEDFPSLRAAQKQKEGSIQKVKQLVSEESSSDLKNIFPFNSSHHIPANGVKENSVQNPRPSFCVDHDHAQKQKDDPLPLISLNPRTDWADDERDTGHTFATRSVRDQDFLKGESYWDKEFDVPRSSALLHKPVNNLFERRVQPVAKGGSTSEVLKEPYREVYSWRTSSVHKERLTVSLGESSPKDFSSNLYDERDPFTENLVGLVKKKRDMIKQTDFHDPVRESFEAELERVQKMQEMERQRIVEQQERVLEKAQREDEDRRRVEEEAREAAWIAEQERLNEIQKAEEQKRDREEEKRRMVMEEERRKQAAKEKLLELEARMAKRESEFTKDSDASMDSEIDNWEVSQRMVERITSASSDSSAMDRPFDQPFDRVQMSSNPWKREAFEAMIGGRSFIPLRSPDAFPHLGDQDHRWNSFESEFYDNVGWGQGYTRNNTRTERLYMNPESDKVYSYGRSRYSMKQPRVLPPPSLSVPRSSVRGENENEISAPSSSLESTARTGNLQHLQQPDIVDLQQGFMQQNQEKNDTIRCDSRSSLSVSSPPSSPTPLSHDELDDSGEGKDILNDVPGDLVAVKSVSTEEDEEWSLENHDELQQQEEYDEDDGYGEEDEVTQQFEHMLLGEKNKNPKNVTENIVLGFNEGVEVKIPGDDEFEKDPKTNGDTNTPEILVVIDKQAAAVEAVVNEHPQNVSESTVEIASSSSGPSSTPVKLQFGLFSGPTLIPSPVPSIQIGSIQMPLPPVGSSMGHIHPSQPPLFQFGQLSYTQPISLVKPNIHHSLFLPYQFPLETSAINSNNQNIPAHAADNIIPSKPGTQTEEKGHGTTNNDSQLQDKNLQLSKAPGPSNRGRRTTYVARTSGSRSFQAYNPAGFNEFQRKHQRPIQRTEFRVRHTANNFGLDDTLNSKGIGNFTRSGYRRQTGPAMSLKRVVREAEIIPVSKPGKESLTPKTQVASSSVDNMKWNIPEDVDAPLQSGVVHVFKQPGIECPSDEDDFIEVRSKRQMLNDRREQREKEIKAKSRVTKQPRKAYGTSAGTSKKEPAAEFSTAAPQLAPQLSAPVDTPIVDTYDTEVADNWGIAQTDQQVIPLTQTQLDEAMKPVRFSTTQSASISEPILPVSSSSSPINSLLAGEKIQLGAVTSPTILPPSSRVVSHVNKAPGFFRPETTENSQKNSKAENDCNPYFKKDEQSTEGEAAVDEAAKVIQGGLARDQQSGSQSKPEEPLSVSLPADLSVETPPISLWTPLPSPQASSPQMLPHYHGPTPSHFPFYDMNHHPMMSGPVFAFSPHDEPVGTKSQPQNPTGSASTHIGPWQSPSGIDSFYGPFISSPGGIPGGVQPPPHMVVYNHYAPVGQSGQVGLSFMGPAYIPSGKQPDWKHDPTSSSRGEEMSSMNMVSGPRNPPNMHPPVPQLGSGLPLLPLGSPLTMFDLPSFQTAPDMAVQARWSHVPAPPLHAVPLSQPLQQQRGTFPPNILPEPQPSTITNFPDELGLVDSSRPSVPTTCAPVTVSHINSETAKTVDDGGQRGGITINNNNGGSSNNNVEFKNQQQQHHQQGKSDGGGYGVSPRNKDGIGQWSHHRRAGFHGRYQPMGAERGFHNHSSTKIKQIYVAKQPTASGGSSSSLG